jgi:SAM-dependent methyltransferase
MKQIISIVLRTIPRKYLHHVSHFFLRIYSFLLRGNNFEDPITGITYRKLLPYGRLIVRPNALAPDSLSLERHRLMWLYLRDYSDFFTKQYKVLHIAPEYCFIDRFKKLENLDYITADLESPWADVKMDIHKMPFKENEFDVVFCNHVLEHVNDQVALQEIYRVMKPGAWAILQSPQDMSMEHTLEDDSITDPKERERVFLQNDHLRLYGRDYGQVIAKAGFEVEENKLVEKIGEEMVKRYALMPDEILYIARKP